MWHGDINVYNLLVPIICLLPADIELALKFKIYLKNQDHSIRGFSSILSSRLLLGITPRHPKHQSSKVEFSFSLSYALAI
jgi:hypothetical protein